ncbi:hypothetical protein OG21DRAFT_1511525 [Imleria badia]|nr:hypothetical protein OG21DRAFT_1511525 [Imleria badia]
MALREIIQEIVEYDILSHRLDEITGEPTFQDILPRNSSSPSSRNSPSSARRRGT